MSRTIEAREYLAELIRERRTVMHERIRVSKAIKELPKSIRQKVLDAPEYQVPEWPTLESVTTERNRSQAYANTPIRDRGGDYYSCCGLEDAEGCRKDAARDHARLLTTVIRVLRWGSECSG